MAEGSGMAGPAREAQLKEIVDRIVAGYDPEEIILFGSFAWGQPEEDSDFDLFIVKDDPRRQRERGTDVRWIVWEMEPCLPVDVLVYTPAERDRRREMGDPFVIKILEKGRRLYKREP
jgi:predicted nucleotidyltransferase